MNNASEDIIIDSVMTNGEIFMQNPQNIAPQNVLDSLSVLIVRYYGFDDKLHQGQMVMHKNLAREVQTFFEHARAIKFPIEKVIPISNVKYKWDEDISCPDNNSSGYNYRLVMGTHRISKHAGGFAFDINPAQNIYVRYDENLNEIFRSPKGTIYDETVPGTLTSNHSLVVLMKNLGWVWGGDWTPESGRVDYQHFEKTI